MATVQLVIEDPVNRVTLGVILESDGHRVVDRDPEVVIADAPSEAVRWAQSRPTLLLASAGGIRAAVEAMRQGVYGYVFVPFQPGEAGLMVERAARSRAQGAAPVAGPDGLEPAQRTLEEFEAEYILATLRRCKNNQAKAARLLGIGRNTLWRKLKKVRGREDRSGHDND